MRLVGKERINPENLNLIDRVVYVNRVCKVVKGGKRFSFNAIVVVGDMEGHIGVGLGKANEVPDAIRKAIEKAKKNIIKVFLAGTTIPHPIETKFGATKVILRPASKGTGIIAGGAVRIMMEVVGIKDILSKVLGSRNPHNVVKATFLALKSLKTPEEVALLRGKDIKEVMANWDGKIS